MRIPSSPEHLQLYSTQQLEAVLRETRRATEARATEAGADRPAALSPQEAALWHRLAAYELRRRRTEIPARAALRA